MKKPPIKPIIKAGIVTDIHYGFDIKSKLGSKGPALMHAFEKDVALYMPDFIVDIGDRISGRNKTDDRRHMESLQQHFNRMAAPKVHITGNHDIRFLTRADNEAITGCPATSWCQDRGNFHFVFWNPEVTSDGTGLHVGAADLQWLKQNASVPCKKTILFSHTPLYHMDKDEPDEYGKISLRFHYAHSHNIRKILEEPGNVVLCMNGHVHRNHHSQINGIHYIAQQALTHMHQKHYRVPARTWSWLEIYDDQIVLKLQGKVRKNYLIPLAA